MITTTITASPAVTKLLASIICEEFATGSMDLGGEEIALFKIAQQLHAAIATDIFATQRAHEAAEAEGMGAMMPVSPTQPTFREGMLARYEAWLTQGCPTDVTRVQ